MVLELLIITILMFVGYIITFTLEIYISRCEGVLKISRRLKDVINLKYK